MFCSTIIPTVGRPTLARAVNSVISQNFDTDDFEVIVVNDSGQPLAPAEWHESPHVHIINTNRRERSVARNTGACAAKGHYLHFLDDDDWIAQDAFQNLWALARQREADWLYGSTRLASRNGNPLVELQHDLRGNSFIQALSGEWIPLQASMIKARTFFEVGGFNPTIAGPEDIDLLRRILLIGDIAGIWETVAFVSWGEEGSTTDYRRHQARSQWAREGILDKQEAFQRMRQSGMSAYWKGRIVRAYLTSMIWNLRRRRILDSIGRGSLGVLEIFLSGPDVLSASFWRAVLKSYQSAAFSRRIAETDNGLSSP